MTSTHPGPFCAASFPGLLSLSGGSTPPPKTFEFLSPIQQLIVCWGQRGLCWASVCLEALNYTWFLSWAGAQPVESEEI